MHKLLSYISKKINIHIVHLVQGPLVGDENSRVPLYWPFVVARDLRDQPRTDVNRG